MLAVQIRVWAVEPAPLSHRAHSQPCRRHTERASSSRPRGVEGRQAASPGGRVAGPFTRRGQMGRSIYQYRDGAPTSSSGWAGSGVLFPYLIPPEFVWVVK